VYQAKQITKIGTGKRKEISCTCSIWADKCGTNQSIYYRKNMSTQNWITITYSNYTEKNDIQFVLTEIGKMNIGPHFTSVNRAIC